MKIVIATGIYPPQIGGPALYAQGLAEALREKGHVVHVVTFGSLLGYPSGIRHVLFLFRLIPRLWRADACIALDTFSVALPSLVGCTLFRVPFVIRTGGDFLWESYLERTNDALPLSRFYTEHKPLVIHEKIIYYLTRFIIRRALLVFSTEYQRNIWNAHYALTRPSYIIANAIATQEESIPPARKNFLWYVRTIEMKNIRRVREAFKKASAQHPDIELEEGAVSHDELMRRIQSCYAVVLPSLGEISPNYILDALRFRKPFILTSEGGFTNWLAPFGTFVDPLDVEDIARAFELLATPEGYREATRKVQSFSENRSYAVIAEEFLSCIKRV